MSTKDLIQTHVKEAMRAKDKAKLNALRLITAAIKQIEIDERIEVDEQRLILILNKLAKQRKESIEQFTAAGRDDLVANEQFELDLISTYLPAPLSNAQIEALIAKAMDETGASSLADMGKVMAFLKPSVQGQADMGQVSALIKQKLQEKSA